MSSVPQWREDEFVEQANQSSSVPEQLRPETIVLHAGWRSDPSTGAVAPPIFQTTAFQFESTEHAAALFSLRKTGHIYSRIGNPTVEILEKRMAALEGGAAALAVASGQAACAYALQTITRAGDNIVSSSSLYGGTWNLFTNTFRDQGIEVRLVDPTDPQSFREATDGKTRAYFGETLANPKLTTFPIEEVAAIGRSLGIPLIVDNTAAPILCKPLQHGAAVVVYSATKYIGGHGTSLGGVVVDGGNFPWEKFAGRQPLLNECDPSYHGIIWSEAVKLLGPVAFIARARAVLLRDLGAALSAFSAFQILQGLETLPLRIERHSVNAQKVADFLDARSDIARVIYPTFLKSTQLERAKKYLTGGYGGLLGFELKKGAAAGRKFIDNLKLIYHVANIGDARTLAVHPATTTHSQLSEEDQLTSGVSPGYVRLSVGIEHIADIIADIRQALDIANS